MFNEFLKYFEKMNEQFTSCFMPFQNSFHSTSGINHQGTHQSNMMNNYISVVSEYPPEGTLVKPYPLIFIHGAFAGAWCWQMHFMPYFAEKGYVCHAINLRGHQDNPLKIADFIAPVTLSDYVSDVKQAIHEGLQLKSEDVILIGHSMGGMVIQKYLEEHNVKASILLASVPPQGIFSSYVNTAIRNPLLFSEITLFQSFGPLLAPLVASPDTMKRALFSPNMPDHIVKYLFDNFSIVNNEPYKVILDLMGLNLPNINKINRLNRGEMLVLGGQNDAFFHPDNIIQTAKNYNAEYKIFDNIAHAIMLEMDWLQVAQYMDIWIEKNIRYNNK